KTEGLFLRDNIKDIILYGNRILSIYNENDNSQFILSGPSGNDGFEIYNSAIKEWIVQSPKLGTLALTTKPATNTFGYLYFIDINSKERTKILEKIVGLTTLTNNKADRVILGEKMNLSIYYVDSKEKNRLDVNTLPEKCIWFEDSINVICGVPKNPVGGKYPEDWYQGINSFSDDIYMINVDSGLSRLVISPEEFSGESIDMIKLALDTDEKFLFFINKKDQSLWSLEITPEIKIETENIETATTTSEN
ncbi:MAG: hypothetical protein PHX25_01990, partial [Candidatus Pacebacteria bacterium]|nr:hypothetical protein [Candidatus Paceibacterota bacterium]